MYAPTDKAYPRELSTYPPESEGYQDEKGSYTKYVPRPELPESLPRHGKPPEYPYDVVGVFSLLFKLMQQTNAIVWFNFSLSPMITCKLLLIYENNKFMYMAQVTTSILFNNIFAIVQ